MFEKEAEEYAEKHAFRVPYDGSNKFYDDKDYECSKEGFQKGAEFGYNKALEEIGDLRDCSNCKHWKYSTRSLSYYCDKTDRTSDCELQCYRCEHWER